MCRMDDAQARVFADRWVKDWNAHDVEALLEHFTDDVVFTSPVAVRLLGGDGIIRGKQALRDYWTEGIRALPDLHFEVLALYTGIDTLVINYRNQSGGLVCEVLTFDGARVREGHGTYLT
jgi:ketosteroid isomerase-like protein